MAKILEPTPENILVCAKAIQSGDIVGVPTETVYGLAANVFNNSALTKVYQTKDRPAFNPLIAHVHEIKDLISLEKLGLIDVSKMAPAAKKTAEALMARFWPGPLTLILPKNSKVPDFATSGLSTIAIRAPKHPVMQQLIQKAETPLAAPSANRSGHVSPTSAKAVDEELGGSISHILDGGPCEIGLESTVVAINDDGRVQLLRPGAITRENILEVVEMTSVGDSQKILSPGLLANHYAPSKPLLLLPSSVLNLNFTNSTELIRKLFPGKPFQQLKAGVLLMSGDADMAEIYLSGLLGLNTICRKLSVTGDLREVGKNLFKEIRDLDSQKIDLILVEPCNSEAGLGHAIMDRLRRAQFKINAKSNT
jgi:L-threonylcarbamoyladenylate synthase